jgi:hypothetical protein
MAHDKKQWARCYLPFNCLGNGTSNDAEGFFGNNVEVKLTGNVYELLRTALTGESSALYGQRTLILKESEFLATPTLRKTYLSRWAMATSVVLENQWDANQMSLSMRQDRRKTFNVNLCNLANREALCTCGVPAIEVVPCVHVIAAVRLFNALQGQVEQLFPRGALRIVAAQHICSFPTPATSVLAPTPGVLRPRWLTVDLPAARVPEHVTERAWTVGRAPPTHFTGMLGARVPSIGEADAIAAAQAQLDNNELRRKVRVTLGTAAGHGHAATAPSQGASQAKRKPTCKICGGTGHYQKTCTAAARAAGQGEIMDD